MYCGSSGIAVGVDNVDAAADKTWQYHELPALVGVPVAAGAGVPTSVVQLVTDIGHVQTVQYLQVEQKGKCCWNG